MKLLVSNEMATPTPCEGYAFAGCFYIGDHHHERFGTGRYRPRQTYLPSARPGQARPGAFSQEALTPADDAVLRQSARVHRGDGGLRRRTLCRSRTYCHRASSQADFPAVRTALRQGQQKRFHRCASDLRSSFASDDALCFTQNRSPANPFSIAPAARVAHPRPHQGGQSDAWLPAGIRYQPAAGAGRHEALVQCSGGARVACSVNGAAAASARSLRLSGRPDQGTGQRPGRPTG